MITTWPLATTAENQTTVLTNSYGTPGGLIDMPTAEMAPLGQLSTTVDHYDGATKTTLTFQVTNRLSASFRYSAIYGLVPGPGRPAFNTYYDRSFDLSFRLVNEGQYMPAVNIGLQDLVGTGLFGGEYIVATKSIGERLRVSAGLGWGRLGSYGAFGSTGSRSTSLLGQGGIPTYDRWFRGDVAPFAGLSYQLTDRMNLSLEYSSDGYDREVLDGITDHDMPWNIGVDYQVSDALNLGVYALHGTEIGVNATLALNARKPAVNGGAETAPVPVAPRAAGAARDLGWTTDPQRPATVQASVAQSLETEGLRLHGFDLGPHRAHVMIRNPRYDMRAQAVGRTARVLTRTLPASVEVLTITQVEKGMPVSSTTFRRSDLERLENAPATEILAVAGFNDPLAVGPRPALVGEAYPRFDWTIGPFLNFSVFDPDNPVRANGGIRFQGDYHIGRGLRASGSVSYKLFGDLDKVTIGPSNLPRVRSNVAQYSLTDDPTLDYLTLAHYGRPAKDFYSRVTVGYLEKMYAGASAEVLWKPVDSRLALGAEVNYVVPRDFDQLFETRTRNTATGTIPEFNGHVSAYYDFGRGFHGRVDAGRYLAGDWGATIALDREFANGWRVGAYATKTDVSSATFGEGSFDKGIRITIPLSWGTGTPTRTKTNTVIRSLSRDGGARLRVNGRLYETVRDTHEPEMTKTWGKFWR
ncbi:YjbH domain-containing protein [Roseovarius sp. A21]|uniref:YjbH domain-containing protein n=1 Tax=Roseovarius bejariae TaxID=2576383 RepID=A0A844CWA3_9RHOB|nr:YjbH domain-containing protein [Roseovarius bejariae]MRU15436.1 YjbH domain-containing protein [Roseovarius bejariae]